MNEISWKLEELRECCSEEDIRKAEIHFKAVRDKLGRILYAVERLKEDPIQPSIDREGFINKQLETLIYLETVAYNLHSLPDVLSHIIFILIINPLTFKDSSLDIRKERNINIFTAKAKLEVIEEEGYANTNTPQKQHIKSLIGAINNLLNSNEYKYIDALVNTIKHRNLIDTEYTLGIKSSKYLYLDENTANKIDVQKFNEQWKLIEFTRNGIKYSSINCDKLVNEYREIIINLFLLTGKKINKYCRVTYLPTRPNT
ncbi:MAG: hypothetical protein ACRCU2_10150 [Planktothrix sp.]